MLRPTIVHTEIVRQSATDRVLADRSRSMQVADVAGKKSRWEAMVSALEEVHPALQDLRELFEVKLYTFDRRDPSDRPLSAAKFGLGAKPIGHQTAIGAVLDDVLRHEAGKRLAGVILLERRSPAGVAAARYAGPDAGSPAGRSRLSAVHGSAGPAARLGPGPRRGHRRSARAAADLREKPARLSRARYASMASSIRRLLVQLLFEKSPGMMEPVAALPVAGPARMASDCRCKLDYVPETPGEYKVTLQAATSPGEMVTTNNRDEHVRDRAQRRPERLVSRGHPAGRAEILAPLARCVARYQSRLPAHRRTQEGDGTGRLDRTLSTGQVRRLHSRRPRFAGFQ